jgi:arginase
MIGAPAVLGAPSAIGLRPYDDGGVRRLHLTPGVLREHGVVERLGAVDLGDVLPPARYADLVKPAGRGRNEADVVDFSAALARSVEETAAAERFLVLLGGDCSIMLGALLGLRRARGGAVGVAYVDAHADFATLEESPSGSACSMNLALAVGRSATPLARLDPDAPLLAPAHAVQIGARDAGQPYGYDALARWAIPSFTSEALLREGPEAAAEQALARLAAVPGGFWIHVDADVLDPDLMPAVDTPEPDGLDYEQLAALLAPLVRHPHALGLQLTIYDPTLDAGAAAPRLVELLTAVIPPA